MRSFVPRLDEVKASHVVIRNRTKASVEIRIPILEADGEAKRDKDSRRMSRPILLGSIVDEGLVGAPQPEATVTREEFGLLLRLAPFKGQLKTRALEWSPAEA